MKNLLLSTVSVLTIFIGIFTFSSDVFAAEILFNTEIDSSNQTIVENFYASGATVRVNNVFEQDIFIVGGNVFIEGTVAGDAIIVGGNLYISGQIDGDLRVIGGDVSVSGKVLGDLLVLGGNIRLLDGAEILGENILIGGSIKQDTKLVGDTKILAASVNINNELGGETEITTQKINFGKDSVISGELTYYSPQRAVEQDGSQITGTINFNEIKKIGETGIIKTTIINIMSFWLLLRFVTTLIIAFILIQVFKVFTQGVADIGVKSIVRSFLFGILFVILVPVIFTVLFVSLIAMPIGLLFLFLYFIVLIVAPSVSGIIAGTLVYRLSKKEKEVKVNFNNAVLGIVLLTAIQFIPTVGDVVITMFFFISVGAMFRFLHRSVIK